MMTTTTIIIVAVVIIALVASLINLAIQVRKARAQEVRASWSASPWGQAQTSRSQAETIWKATFQIVYRQTGGNFGAACRSADAVAQPYFKAAHASEELARKASSSAVQEAIEDLKG